MFISIIVCTRDRADVLDGCLKSLVYQDHPGDAFEIVVVDDGSKDGTSDLVQRSCADHPARTIRYVRQDHGGLSRARNRGFAEARGDVMCYIDDDEEAERYWLREVAEGVQRHPDTGCFVGRILVRLEGPAPRTCGREPFAGSLDAGDEEREIDLLKGGNMIIRRDTFEEVGGFNPVFSIRGDEDEWHLRLTRLGGAVVYLPHAMVWHRRLAHELRLPALIRTRFNHGRWNAVYSLETGEPAPVKSLARGAILQLAHALRRRCWGGVIIAAWQVGFLWGLSLGRLRPPKQPS